MNRICLLLAWCAVSSVLVPAAHAGAPDNLLRNSSFETKVRDSGWFGLWEIDARIAVRGQQSRTRQFMTDGRFGFKLFPNELNIEEPSRLSYGIYQLIPTEGLRGKPLLFRASMRAEGGAAAVLRMIAVTQDGLAFTRILSTADGGTANDPSSALLKRDIFEVPDLPIEFLFIICSVEGTSGVAYFDDVSVSPSEALTWQQGQPEPETALIASSDISFQEVRRNIPRTLFGINLLYPHDGSGVWNSAFDVPNPSMFSLLQDLGVTTLRYPGGGFANFYHWKNGIGAVANRPLAVIAPDRGVTTNGFGTDEVMELATLLNIEEPLLFTVNADTGTPEEAAEWLAYANRNGRRVAYWEIGNELYFSPDPGDPTSGASWQPTAYVKQFRAFAAAMRAVDPEVKLAADMEFNLGIGGCGVIDESGCWSDVLLTGAADQIDYLALHSATAPIMLGWDPGWDLRTVYAAMLASPVRVKELLDKLSAKVDRLAQPDASRIRFAMAEWGPLFAADPKNRFINHGRTLGSALLTASLMKTLIEHPRVDMAQAFSFADLWTSGWVGFRDGEAVPEAPYHAFELYSKHFGSQSLAASTYSPVYDAHSVGLVGAVDDVPYLDVTASRNPDGQDLRVIAVNKNFDRPIRTWFRVTGFSAQDAEVRTLTGSAIDANTGTRLPVNLPEDFFAPQAVAEPDGRFDLGGPGEISVNLTSTALTGSCFEYEFPPMSVTSLIIRGVELQPGETSGCPEPTVSEPEFCGNDPNNIECNPYPDPY